VQKRLPLCLQRALPTTDVRQFQRWKT
jgi:hypothetical protein